jgi:hypothetical protein
MSITKPAVRPAWADGATTSADIVDPGNTFVDAGWLLSTTPPARQYFNWLINYCMNGVRYFSRRGVADYDAAETYQTGDVTIADNGVLMQSLAANQIGHVPSSSPAYWGPLAGYSTTAQVNNAIATALLPYVTTGTFNATLLSYVTSATLAATLAGYVTNAALAAALASYVTNATLAATLASYATVASLANYVTNAAFAATIAAYATTASVNAGLALKADLNSPIFGGTPAGPTAPPGTNNTQLASTAFVTAAVGSPPPLMRTGSFNCVAGGVVAVAFTPAFPASCTAVSVQWAYASPAVGWVVPGSRTAAGFTYFNGNAGACTYIAIGS